MSNEFQIQILTVALQHSAHTHHPPPGGVRLRLPAASSSAKYDSPACDRG
jgi:hypothetical protein